MQEVEEVIAAIPSIMEKLRKLSPYWSENGPVEEPEKAFAPTYA
jgi:cysteine desulfurase